jgi:hypothetical protein
MSNRTELTAERERLQKGCEAAQRTYDDWQARIVAIDAELARPQLPEGWTPVSELPAEGDVTNYRVLLHGWQSATRSRGDDYEAVAWYSHLGEQWNHPHSGERVAETVVAYKPLSLDWIAPAKPEPKYPRYFRHVDKIGSNIAYVRFDSPGIEYGACVRFDGTVDASGPCWSEERADKLVSNGDWLEITAAEAEAMVTPKVEPTTERLAEAFYLSHSCINRELSDADYNAIRHRITAYPRLIDPATLWEPVGERHEVDGKPWLAQLAGHAGFFVAKWLEHYGRWDVTYPDGMVRSSPHVTVTRIADPARLLPAIGGGA